MRDVAALEAELAALAKRADAYGDRWRILAADVRESLIASFVRAHPAWEARLAPEAVAALEADARAGLLGELLPRLEEHARRTRQATRLARVRAHAERLDGAEWRIEVRRGALLRLRTLLVAIAGRRLARGENAAAVARLDACEAFSPGPLPAAPRPPAGASPTPAFPPLARDAALLEDLAPSWLGVRYRPVSPAMRAERRLPEGATAVEAVLPGSPAEEAGLQAGDVLLGPPGRPFEASWELREWTMTAPRGAPRRLSVLRPGVTAESDRRLEVEAVLARLPVEVP